MSKAARTIAVLEHLVDSERPPTHAELMRATGISRSTLGDLLADLRALGYVRQVEGRRYAAGPGLVAFVCRAASRQAELLEGVRPALARIARKTGETAAYVVELPCVEGEGEGGGRRIVAVGEEQGTSSIRYVADIGVPHPIETSAAGQALRAFGDGDGDEGGAGEGDGDDGGAGESGDAEIRARGYAIRRGESGSTAIAAPVRDATGCLAGAIAVVGPTERMEDAATRVWPVLREALAGLAGS